MQDAVPVGTGAMAAILGLDDDAVRAACTESAQGEVVEAVNFNAPSQVVIAGHKAAVERAAAAAKAKGAKRAVMLPVSAPFHASLLKPAAERLEQVLSGITFHAPQIPIVNNVDVAVVTDPQLIKAALARQACNPVRWVEVIQHMKLQTDPTVIYGLGEEFDGNLRKRDLIADGPYNTYVRTGLPPTPIALPGIAALTAALNPAPGKALYFVARGDGSSHFSNNLADHERAVTKYQRRGTR